jgi:hypothetical protein
MEEFHEPGLAASGVIPMDYALSHCSVKCLNCSCHRLVSVFSAMLDRGSRAAHERSRRRFDRAISKPLFLRCLDMLQGRFGVGQRSSILFS